MIREERSSFEAQSHGKSHGGEKVKETQRGGNLEDMLMEVGARKKKSLSKRKRNEK